MSNWVPHRQRQILLFLMAAAFLGAASGVFETTFNNYLNDTFHLTAAQRGGLEFPRELPGFLTALFSGALFFMVEAHTAALCALGIAFGMFGLATWAKEAHQFAPMLAFTILWSTGTHLLMPMQSAIGLGLSEKGREATLLGRLGATSTAATIVGCGFVWLATDYLSVRYSTLFLGGALAALCGALVYGGLRVRRSDTRRKAFLVQKRYRLYYALCVLFGARKQVFITFGPWVLIKVFHQPPSTFAKLWIVSALIGVVFKPVLGQWIDRHGERRILMADAALMVLVCLGYGFAGHLGLGQGAVWLIYACYVLDQVLFATGIARTTYVDKIAARREDVAPTLSLGVSLDHAVSMSIPTVGGWIWARWGYPYVFAAAAAIAVINGITASFVRAPTREKTLSKAEPIGVCATETLGE